jgi:hypothetical protein
MHIQVARDSGLDLVEEFPELRRAMAWVSQDSEPVVRRQE